MFGCLHSERMSISTMKSSMSVSSTIGTALRAANMPVSLCSACGRGVVNGCGVYII